MIIVLLTSCDSEHTVSYRGALYFGQDAYLMRYSMHDGKLSVEGHLGDTTIREISALGSGHLLIAESALVNRKPVARISWFDLETGESADLYPGPLARYLPGPDLIVYDDGSTLFAVPQRDGSANEVIWEHPPNHLSRLVDASPDLLLIEADVSVQAAIYAWSPRTGDRRRLDGLTASCRLEGAVWVEPLQRLVCKPRSLPPADARYVVSDLDGVAGDPLKLPEEGQFLALTYIDEQQLLLLQQTRKGVLGGRDQHSLWVYDISSGASHRLPGSVNLGKSVVYAEF